MPFKTATNKERESAVKGRDSTGLSYVSGNIPIFKPVDGDNQIRIVPPSSDDTFASIWGLEVWAYYINNQSMISSKTFDPSNDDPIQRHFFDTRESNPEAAMPFKGTKRHLMYVLDLNDTEEELKLWAAPPTLIDTFIGLSKNRRTGELIPIEDPKLGRAIFFSKTGKGIGTRYDSVEIDKDPMVLDEQLAEQLVPFAELLVVPSAEELQKVLDSALRGAENTVEDEDQYSPRESTRVRPSQEPAPAENPAHAPPPVPATENPAPVQAAPVANPSQAPAQAPAPVQEPPARPSAPVANPAQAPAPAENPVDGIQARVRAKIEAERVRKEQEASQ